MTGFALKTVIIVVVIALVVIVVARSFHRQPPNVSRPQGSGRRMPVLAWLAAAVLLGVGFVLALVSFTSRFTDELLPMRIAAVAALLAGGAVLLVASRRARNRKR
ncbi:hypothetical protein ACWIDW_12300 [Microbacterium sp. NPDC055312]